MNPAEWHHAGQDAVLAGHRIFFHDSGGSRPVLVLLHGFPTSSWDWVPVRPMLGRHFRLIAPDFLGYGFSDRPVPHDYTIAEQAQIVVELLQRQNIRAYHLLTHDYGDTVAQELLARRADDGADDPDILSVCLLNGGLFPETHRPRLIQKLLLTPAGPVLSRLQTRRSFGKSFAAVFGPDTRPTEEQLDAFWDILTWNGAPRLFHRLLQYIPERMQYRDRWAGALQKATCPLRLINGLLDPVSGAHMVERYRELVPAADVVELPHVGHYPQTEAPQQVVRSVLEFHGLDAV